jgi:chromosome segregation ATPase
MYFVAGLLVAGLVMMLILPAFWRRALRLSARRARLQTPLSVSDAIAERDQLRAEHAVASRLLERRLESLQTALARERAELGREIRRSELDEDKARSRREIAALRGELESKRRAHVATEAELGAGRLALYDISAQLDRALAAVTELRAEAIRYETRADEQRAAIAGVETRAAGLEMRLADQAQAFRREMEALEAGRAREARDTREKLGDVAALDAALAEKDRLNRELADRLARAEESGRDPAAAQDRDGDRALREAIAKLGGDVLRLMGQDEEASSSLMRKLGAPQEHEPFPLAPPSDKKDKAPPLRRARTTSHAP